MVELDLLGVLRLSHVLAGMAGLGLFWIPVFAPKGGPLHVRCGRLFTWCAYYVGGTGLIFSCWALGHPWSFFGDSETQPPAGRELAIALENTRFLYSITGFLALGVLAGTLLGVRIARAKSDHAAVRAPLVLAALSAFALWSVALLLYGAWNLIAALADTDSSRAGGDRYWLSFVLGSIGICGVFGDFKYIFRPTATPMAWWYQHMECMLGAGIGFHAAAFFFISRELLELPLRGAWQLAPLLLPVIIGAPAMWLWIAHYERRFEGDVAQ